MPQSFIYIDKHFLKNKFPSRLFFTGAEELLSQEGSTQVDPLFMPFDVVSTCMLINSLRKAFPEVKHVWLADDTLAGETLKPLHKYLKTLITEGTKYGYHVNQKKS